MLVRIDGPDILRTGSVRLQNHRFFAPFLEFLDQEKALALIIFDNVWKFTEKNDKGRVRELSRVG